MNALFSPLRASSGAVVAESSAGPCAAQSILREPAPQKGGGRHRGGAAWARPRACWRPGWPGRGLLLGNGAGGCGRWPARDRTCKQDKKDPDCRLEGDGVCSCRPVTGGALHRGLGKAVGGRLLGLSSGARTACR